MTLHMQVSFSYKKDCSYNCNVISDSPKLFRTHTYSIIYVYLECKRHINLNIMKGYFMLQSYPLSLQDIWREDPNLKT
jgi:hypothetical protein